MIKTTAMIDNPMANPTTPPFAAKTIATTKQQAITAHMEKNLNHALIAAKGSMGFLVVGEFNEH
jgi:hypothetical protein